MNLQKLFEAQKVLDERIIKEKGLEGQDLLPNKILALQVELGELANEWRGFKHWSNDREPRGEIKIPCPECHGEGVKPALGDNLGVTEIDCMDCDENCEVTINPLLEEYVDCLHFILSIGLDAGYEIVKNYKLDYSDDITDHFNDTFCSATDLKRDDNLSYTHLFARFYALGKLLGFTWEQIEQAYFEKNKVNHERQTNGY